MKVEEVSKGELIWVCSCSEFWADFGPLLTEFGLFRSGSVSIRAFAARPSSYVLWCSRLFAGELWSILRGDATELERLT